ncbi:type II toxin-antitoxin system HicA family toxin [Treponema vincentii]|uniref:type II toxin-antitoxin system HicA family toxin n=1 Tax=Treponema vincentii TaxID=69710 RepID=UPI0035F58A9A
MKGKDLLKLLLKDGWELISVKDSHHKITKGGKTEIIPVHGKDIKKGLLFARGIVQKIRSGTVVRLATSVCPHHPLPTKQKSAAS